jgi:hypothetical protein
VSDLFRDFFSPSFFVLVIHRSELAVNLLLRRPSTVDSSRRHLAARRVWISRPRFGALRLMDFAGVSK